MAERKQRITRTYRGDHFLFASRSSMGDDCIGVAGHASGGPVAFLDSKAPEGPLVEVSRQSWERFLGAVKTA